MAKSPNVGLIFSDETDTGETGGLQLSPELRERAEQATRSLDRAEELRDRYLDELEESCLGNQEPGLIARSLLASWLAELRADYETRIERLETEVARLYRRGRSN